MERINLNEDWSLKEAPLSYKKEMAGHILAQQSGWYTQLNLPFDVHTPLIKAGVIKDPILADYSFDCEWIENRSWWFKKVFIGNESMEEASVCRLIIESLDVNAHIFLNGAYLGHHVSAHYPFVSDIKEFILPGENTLLIRLTAGLECVTQLQVSENDYITPTELPSVTGRGDKRCSFIRKPAYVFGWDWNPRIATVAIAKNVYIDCYDSVALASVGVETIEIDRNAELRVDLGLELLDIIATADADVRITICYEGITVAETTLWDKLLLSGINYISTHVTVPHPNVWWPNGMGDQPLYDIDIAVICDGKETHYPSVRFGIRTITLDTSRLDEKNRKFNFVVNGIPIFCKGGNWVPADSIYARVIPEKYDALVREAADANFNMLRVWGGGIFERDEFYDACDKYGMLVWQDMMFACMAYPDYAEDFCSLVGKELDYQTKRLRSRACIALFCGDNEKHISLTEYDVAFKQAKQYGVNISNNLSPDYIKKNCPWIPYWNSSPYGGNTPNSPHVGDVHHWNECMMNEEMSRRIEPKEYDKVEAHFVSEYGYPGPPVKKSVEDYFDGKPIEKGGKVWKHHNNTFEKFTVDAGIKKHFTDKQLDLDQYLLYAGLTQSLMLNYSLESLRSKDFCGGALFWMYNDCWGEVGWTIIDYYLRRKISYYGVKRAFSPIKLIMRSQQNTHNISIFGANDTDSSVDLQIEYGYVSFDGSYKDSKKADVQLKSFSRNNILSFEMGTHDTTRGVYFATTNNQGVTPAILQIEDIRNLKLCCPMVKIKEALDYNHDKVLILKSETVSFGVYIETECKMSDNFFDMLPFEEKKITIQNGAGKDFQLKIATCQKE